MGVKLVNAKTSWGFAQGARTSVPHERGKRGAERGQSRETRASRQRLKRIMWIRTRGVQGEGKLCEQTAPDAPFMRKTPPPKTGGSARWRKN